MSPIKSAYQIAAETLRSRYRKDGITAGAHHFSDIWARDSLFASLGAMVLGDMDVVRHNIDTLLIYQRQDGMVPLRVGQKHFMLKYLFGWNGRTQARYIEDKNVSLTVDPTPLLIILTEAYLMHSGDRPFIQRILADLKAAAQWITAQDSDGDGLIEEGPYANWADSLHFSGKVLYSNVLVIQAYQALSRLCEAVSDNDTGHYAHLAYKGRERLTEVFWQGRYFVNWVSTVDGPHNFFVSDGNLLAILYDIATPEQAASIQAFLTETKLDSGFCIGTNYPNYPSRYIYPPFRWIHFLDYHNGLRWLWLGCLDAVVKYKMGLQDAAYSRLECLAHKIMEFDGVYEVYEPSGRPCNRFFYKSEDHFAWSSGMFVWACHVLNCIK